MYTRECPLCATATPRRSGSYTSDNSGSGNGSFSAHLNQSPLCKRELDAYRVCVRGNQAVADSRGGLWSHINQIKAVMIPDTEAIARWRRSTLIFTNPPPNARPEDVRVLSGLGYGLHDVMMALSTANGNTRAAESTLQRSARVVRRPQQAAGAGAPAPAFAQAAPPPSATKLAALQGMGFQLEQCRTVLAASNGDLNIALDMLMSGGGGAGGGGFGGAHQQPLGGAHQQPPSSSSAQNPQQGDQNPQQEAETECCVCFNPFDNNDVRLVRLHPCGHRVMCAGCYGQASTHATNNNTVMRCPLDRKVVERVETV
jgi:hypothetical protein